MLVRQVNLEKVILEAMPPALIHHPNRIAEVLEYEVRRSRRVVLTSIFARKPEFTRDTAA
jgi:hypothetical protein